MTIPTTSSASIFLGNGVTTTFTFPWVGVSASDITASYVDTDGNSTPLTSSQFTLFLNPANAGALWGVGGTITYPTVGSPIANGTQLVVSRTLPLTQTTSIQNQGDFAAQVTEEALDILCMQNQQTSARTGAMRGFWATNTIYNFGDIVQDGTNGTNSLNLYTCVVPGTSGAWATDLANGVWSLAFNYASFISNVGNMPPYTVLGNSTAGTLAPAFTNSPTVSGTITGAALVATGNVTGNRLISSVATGTAPFTVASTTAVTNLRADLSLVNDWTGQQNTLVAALTDNPTIAWDLNTQQNAKLTIAGNRTLGAPTNAKDGGFYILRITQAAGGSHTLGYNAAYKFPGGVKPALSTAAGAIDILQCSSDGTSMFCTLTKAFS